MADPDTSSLDGLLQHLREVRAFDFTGYKRATLSRRVDKRMQQLGIAGYGEYIDYLQVHADEFEHLFNTILINVTSFFRDIDTWDALRAQIPANAQTVARSASGVPVVPVARRPTRR